MRLHCNPVVPSIALVITFAGAAPAGDGPARYLKKPDDWFDSADAKRIATNILTHQSDLGGWPKNTDTTTAFAGDRKDIKPTFDNGATTDELRFLARVYASTKDETYHAPFDRGLSYILKAQYPTGGWPQFYPPPARTYHRHVTFNDSAMVRLMEFLREVATKDGYAFVAAGHRKDAAKAFDRGIECILKCQIKVGGQLTVWCAQHDEIDFSPRPGRAFELVSLSGAESVWITHLLMSLESPSPEVVQAVEGAVAWFQAVKLAGVRVESRPDPKALKGTDKVLVKDPAAPPLWARFYEIGTNRPVFSDRDGVKRYEIAEIGYERRNGYAWYGAWPQRLLDVDYEAWKKRLGK